MPPKTNSYRSIHPILLIEDNPGDARLVEIFLEEHDLQTVHKATLADGMQALEEGTFAAILLDMHLPDSRGFETLERVVSRFPDANVIVLTGLGDRDFGLNAIGSGAQDFLVKGEFSSDQLVKTLDYSIERHRITRRLEEAHSIASLGHFEYDSDEGSFHAADEIYKIFGRGTSANPLTVKDLKEIIHPDDLSVFYNLINQISENNERREDVRIFRDGALRYITIHARPILNATGNVVGASGIVQDVTERTLKDISAIKDKQRYQTIFHQSRDAICLTDESKKLYDFNEAMISLFGYSSDEIKGLSLSDLFKENQAAEQLFRELDTNNEVIDFEAHLKRKDGSLMDCLITANETVSEDINGYQATIRDITEQKSAQRLQQEKEIAERGSRLKEQFLASVSHEMRTPLNAVLGMSHLMMKTEMTDEQSKFISTIMSQSDHLLGIINDILSVTKLVNGGIEFVSKPFDLHKTIHDLFRVVKYEAGKKGLETKFKIDQSLDVAVKGDLVRFQEILNNLATNAIKFTEEGSISISATKIGETEKSTWVKLVVKDTGIGMKEDQLPLIFENFVRVTNDRNKLYEGVGLGLSIVKSLVEQQGGSIYVESELEKGSTFTVEMEFEKCKIADLEKSRPNVSPNQLKDLKLRILLVEDNKVNQLVAKKTITKEWPDVELKIANNGKEGLELVKNNDFDIILMDIQMPVMDGIEATARIREMDFPKAATPILAMTAHVNVAQEETYKSYHMDDCVLKPFKPDELFEKINKYARKNIEESELINGSMNQQSNFKYINLEYLELMADGDVDMKAILLEMLLSEPVEEFRQMKQYMEEKDWDQLKQVSHKMKTTLPYIGYQDLINTNVNIDRLLWESKEQGIPVSEIEDKVPAMVEDVIRMYELAKVELQSEFTRLKSGVA